MSINAKVTSLDAEYKSSVSEDEIDAKITSLDVEFEVQPEPEPKPEPTPWEKFLGYITTSLETSIVFLAGLSNENKNIVLQTILERSDGESIIENWAYKVFDKFTEEYPEYKSWKNAPRSSVSIIALLMIIGSILGFGTLVGWLRKEVPEPAGMAVWAMIENENWEGAKEANEKYKKFIKASNSWFLQSLTWLNPFLANFYNKNAESQFATAESYDDLINEHLKVKTGILLINTDPTDAKVSVAGQYSTTGTFQKELEVGNYSYVVSLFGYISQSGTASVSEGKTTTKNVTLNKKEPEEPEEPEEKPLGRITINSNPQGAKIYIDGEYQYTTTPFTKQMEAGAHVVRLELEGYHIKEQMINWQDGVDKEKIITLVAVEPEPSGNYKVTVKSNPSGAQIIINGYKAERNNNLLYTTDYVILKPGTYDFTVYKAGYKIPTAKRVVLQEYG